MINEYQKKEAKKKQKEHLYFVERDEKRNVDYTNKSIKVDKPLQNSENFYTPWIDNMCNFNRNEKTRRKEDQYMRNEFDDKDREKKRTVR
jgi:hypothetical protein